MPSRSVISRKADGMFDMEQFDRWIREGKTDEWIANVFGISKSDVRRWHIERSPDYVDGEATDVFKHRVCAEYILDYRAKNDIRRMSSREYLLMLATKHRIKVKHLVTWINQGYGDKAL